MREEAQMEVTFRTAKLEDTSLLLQLIRELAEYEHLLPEVVAE